MVVILDLGDGLDDDEQLRYDQFVQTVREGEPEQVWTSVDVVPQGCKPLPRGVMAWAFKVTSYGENPLLFVPPPTTAEEVQAYFALDPEQVQERVFRVVARDVLKDTSIAGSDMYDPTPNLERTRRRLDDLLANHGYATT